MSSVHKIQKVSSDKVKKHFHIHHEENLYGESKEVPAVFSYSTSFEFDKKITPHELQNSLMYWIESIKYWALQNKYFIGHIKIFVETAKKFNLWISTTGRNINIKTSEDNLDDDIKSININITVIIFGTDKQTLQSVTLENLNKSLLGHSK